MKKKKIGIRSEKSTRNFVVNTKKNPKEECKMFLTRSKRKESLEKEESHFNNKYLFPWQYITQGREVSSGKGEGR